MQPANLGQIAEMTREVELTEGHCVENCYSLINNPGKLEKRRNLKNEKSLWHKISKPLPFQAANY